MFQDSLIKFYNDNKDKSFKLEPLPDLSVEEQAEWILQQKHIGWIKLDIKFNKDLWKQEMLEAEGHYHDYGDGNDTRAWASCCIHGLGIKKVFPAAKYGLDEATTPHNYTELAEKVPSIANFWKNDFPHTRYSRIRFMKLGPGGYLGVHNDYDLPDQTSRLDFIIPVNLAISHPDGCDWIVEDCGTVPWNDGDVFLIDVSKNHCVINQSNKPRIHMVAYIFLDGNKKDFSELLVRSYSKMLEKVTYD